MFFAPDVLRGCASSLVNRDVPSWTIAAGVPCRPIGRVELRDGKYQLVYEKRSLR